MLCDADVPDYRDAAAKLDKHFLRASKTKGQ
jgi:hypothetical protein